MHLSEQCVAVPAFDVCLSLSFPSVPLRRSYVWIQVLRVFALASVLVEPVLRESEDERLRAGAKGNGTELYNFCKWIFKWDVMKSSFANIYTTAVSPVVSSSCFHLNLSTPLVPLPSLSSFLLPSSYSHLWGFFYLHVVFPPVLSVYSLHSRHLLCPCLPSLHSLSSMCFLVLSLIFPLSPIFFPI